MNSDQLNILYLIDSLSAGGAEQLLVNVANEISCIGNVRVHVGTTFADGGKLQEKLHPSIPCLHFDCAGLNYFKGVLAIRKYIREKAILIVHAHLDSIIISRFAVPRSVKVIATYHNMDFSPEGTYYSKWRVVAEKLTHKKKYISTYVSRSVGESLESLRRSSPGKHFVLPNFVDGVSTDGYTIKPSGDLKLITIANIKKVKNLGFIIETMAGLKDLPVTWDIYGEGPDREALQLSIQSTGACVRLLGWQNISADVLGQYDLFAITSFDEGMPMSLLEAMTFGLPSLLPDHLQVMKDVAGGSAVYFSIKDKTGLQKIIIDLAENKTPLGSMNQIAKERIKCFSKNTYIEKLLGIYKSE